MSTSLGAGLFGFPPAPGFTAPDQAPPEAWLLLFLDEHGDDELYSGLFGSCKAGRAWALRTAPEACLELNTIKVQHPDAWRARLGRGCDALSVRGPLPARLEVTCNSSTGSLAACCLVPSAFYGHGGAITALQINDWWPCAAATALLPLAAAALQQLTRLSLHPCPPSIPPPASLPHLRELDVYIDAQGTPQEACDACLRSCAAYLPHLSTFAITYCTNNYDDMRPWRLLFNPASRTTTLTSLALPDTAVPDELFDLLLRYTPALIRLHVACLWLREDRSGDEWAVQALVAPSLVKHYAYLPRSSKGVTRVYEDEDLEFEIDCREGIKPALVRRLPEFLFNAKTLSICPTPDLPAADRPAALGATLAQVCERLQVEGPRRRAARHRDMVMERDMGEYLVAQPGADGPAGAGWAQGQVDLWLSSNWVWTADTVRAYAQYVPALQQKGMQTPLPDIKQLTDELLAAYRDAGPQLRTMSVSSVKLQSAQPAGAAWPWDAVTVWKADLTQLVRLGQSAGEGAPRKLECSRLHMTSSVFEVGVDVLRAWLQHIEWQGSCGITLHCPKDAAYQVATQQAYGTLLRAMRFAPPRSADRAREAHVKVILDGWPLTQDVMQELSALPDWACTVHFSECTWSLEHEEYRALARHLPTAYSAWVLPGQPGSALVESIVARLGPQPVRLLLTDYEGEPVKQGEHALLLRGSPAYYL